MRVLGSNNFQSCVLQLSPALHRSDANLFETFVYPIMSAICIVLPKKYSVDDKARFVRYLKSCKSIGFLSRVPGIEQLIRENRMSISVSAVSLHQQGILRSRRHSGVLVTFVEEHIGSHIVQHCFVITHVLV